MKVFIIGILGIFLSATAALAVDCSERFSWLQNPEADIAGYKIHYGLTNGGPYSNTVNIAAPTPTNGRIFGEVSGLTCNKNYYFVLTAYNSASLESNVSSQVALLLTAPVSGTTPVSGTAPVSGTGGMVTKILGSAAGADYTGTIQDTYLNIDETNNSSSQQLNTYTWPAHTVANAIVLKVNLSQLPKEAQIQSATLQLYASEAGGDSAYEVSAHKIINHNPDLSASTGYTYDGANNWTANTSSYNNIPLAQADIMAAEGVTNVDLSVGYKSWDVTNMVRDWLADANTNYGLLLDSDSNASADSFRNFVSTEGTNANQRPKLILTYTLGDSFPIIIHISSN